MDLSHPPLPASVMQQKCLDIDLSRSNTSLISIDAMNTEQFSAWLMTQMRRAKCSWARGGYAEDRLLYQSSPVFRTAGGTRSIHLGIDLWVDAGTPVFAVDDGRVHSFADNAKRGDYGPTIILELSNRDKPLFVLYGHLSRTSLRNLEVGQAISAGQPLGWVGRPVENLGWVPHLHFQLITDMQGRSGDYPGVCLAGEEADFLAVCPDPTPLMQPWMGEIVAHEGVESA